MVVSNPYHLPVMAAETIALILDAPAGPIIDGTLGGGGHSAHLAKKLQEAGLTRELIGVDQDQEAIHAATNRLQNVSHFRAVRGNFRNLKDLLPGIQAGAILLDIGVSSWQLDAAHRGFAIKHPDAPLDMRMDPTQGESAHELIQRLELDALARILRDYGELRDAYRIADRMKEAAVRGELERTGQLSALLEREIRQHKRHIHPATLVFQALRIAVNDELGALAQILADAPDLLLPEGRLLVMSYHSLEDRMVKRAFHEGEHGPPRPSRLPPPSDWHQTWRSVTRKALKASPEEIALNPRARSARLRAAAKVAKGAP